MRVIALCLLMTSMTLAGCTDAETGPEPVQTVDVATFQLEEGKGAIAGLLVDDAFRPIHLTDSPLTQFQTTGFVLLQETGDQTQTTENGEFTFVDLAPGQYTVRVTADGHEAVPAKVRVEDGEFSEASVVARRVSSETSLIVTQEYAGFIPCAVQVMVETIIGDCTGDRSGDSSRISFESDYSSLGANVTALKVEMLANHVGDYGLQMGWSESTLDYGYYEIWDVFDVDYSSAILHYGLKGNSSIAFAGVPVPIDPWMNDRPIDTTMFLYGEGSQEARNNGVYPFTGVGVDLGVKAQFLHSVFVGEPTVDLEAYCVLC